MLIIKTQAEVEALIKDNVLIINDSVTFECSIDVDARIEVMGSINAGDISAWNIKAWNINAGNIKAENINAWNISAWNIKAENINAWNIKAKDIDAWNIKAKDIDAWNIKAKDIDARNIDAWNIDACNIYFYAVCVAYKSFKCKSLKGRRDNSKYLCLDSEIKIGGEQC
jgi:hypothetical protein